MAADWRQEQDVEDMRAALAPYVAAKAAGNKGVTIGDFLVTSRPTQTADDQPGPGAQEGMAAAFRRFAKAHNRELEKRRKRANGN